MEKRNPGIPGLVTSWPGEIRRTCRVCGREAREVLPPGWEASTRFEMECPTGHTFMVNPGSLEIWWARHSFMVEFYKRRKAWARELMKKKGLLKPGDSLEAEFEGRKYLITIGPRKGIRIRP